MGESTQGVNRADSGGTVNEAFSTVSSIFATETTLRKNCRGKTVLEKVHAYGAERDIVKESGSGLIYNHN